MAFAYSTDNLRQHEKAQYWHDSVAAHLIPAEASYADASHFEGSLKGGELGGLTICQMQANPHTFVRTSKILRQSPDEDFVATFLHEGEMTFAQAGREVKAKPGSIVVLDAGQPFRHEMGQIKSSIVRLPRRLFLARFPRAGSLTSVEIANDDGLTGLLRTMVFEGAQLRTSPGSGGEMRYASALVDMIISAMERTAGSASKDVAGYRTLYNRATAFMDSKLDDAELNTTSIARAINTSTRTLARAFAAERTTVMHFLWARRLQVSFSLLAERRVSQVTQAAYQCGFNDLSHFNRAFKAEFGMTPGKVLRNGLPGA
ncbi:MULTISPECIES: helix-turn-helix domain-containing protein [unclassified Rhizobium]|uniref:helix-turn-helix domain-containing protein n=1 Tax=unclassified Rhizobium TaxID=2613769 RepID=UPI001ADAE1BA|nr:MULTISPECIES: helix-turn-helix domain-containing protein [unclassified Rhizobium]MBO9127747.1 helix-turn-helix domain-containing protein [Rhizobium sp. 16-488-2b]MBO9178209.1 helix-turn-helix domain-containing protein [Rhizobium sp. 16-488-2a]